ncbi:MAG: arylsulfatase A-like enzyme [Planctomycetota bacterium]|jgi:arylsulfatase A-like enzyme
MAIAASTRVLVASFGFALLTTACGSEATKQPNVLLISLDSTRRDMLGVYGYQSPNAPGVSNTPNLEAFAAQGIVMEEAYSTTSWTLPSHVSMLLGEPELVHAVDLDHQRPDPDLPPLASLLKEAGYRTAGYFSAPYLESHFGFARGFDRYQGCYGEVMTSANGLARLARDRVQLAEKSGDPAALVQAIKDETAADQSMRAAVRRTLSSSQVTGAVLEELDQAANGDQPFFVFAHFFDPHYDYVAPAPYDTRFDPDYTSSISFDDLLGNPAISLPDERTPFRRKQVLSERDLDHARALYAGELAWTDSQLGLIFDKLDELGLTEDTLVIITADHGDEFFEHKNLGHRSTLFEEQVQVPMILRYPSQLPKGERRRGLVSTIDVVPTVLELTGVESPEGLSSSSFAGLAEGEDDAEGRFVLGRIVRHSSGRIQLPGTLARDVAAVRMTLLETFRQGSIKVTRERNWATLQEEVPEDVRAAFETQSAAIRSQERLTWIDIERFPMERPKQHSDKFDDPRAALALLHFQECYRELLARRGQAGAVEAGARDAQISALEALGYAGVGLGASGDEDKFVFPPPGE